MTKHHNHNEGPKSFICDLDEIPPELSSFNKACNNTIVSIRDIAAYEAQKSDVSFTDLLVTCSIRILRYTALALEEQGAKEKAIFHYDLLITIFSDLKKEIESQK